MTVCLVRFWLKAITKYSLFSNTNDTNNIFSETVLCLGIVHFFYARLCPKVHWTYSSSALD